mgnify:FL=1
MSKVIGSARAFHHGIEELIGILNVRQLGDDLFEGASVEGAVGRVFGGQVVAQALGAAEQTVDPSKVPHSLHAYFMRAGNAAEPIRYRVERDRDGRNFSTRRVVALQREQPILSAMVNFQIAEGGPSHQIEMPDVKGPDELPPRERTGSGGAGPRFRPFEMRPVFGLESMIGGAKLAPATQVWFKANGELPDDQAFHPRALAYVSDSNLLGAAMLPHGIGWQTPGTQTASLDHVLWLHEPVRADEWHLYVTDSPWSGHARGLVRGSIFNTAGKLVASSAQEGLVRILGG